MLALLLVIGGLVALVLQNWSPVLPLVLFGTTTIALPLAVWISLFMGAGVLTSLLLQLINYRSRPPQNVRPAPPQADPDLPPPPPRREMPKPPPSQQPQSDWETSLQSEDWTTPKTPQPPPQPNFEKRSPTQPPPPQPQRPPVTKKATPPNPDVYDANFRILNQPSSESDFEDDEDWGFDDEELESEYRRNWPGN